MGDVGQIVNSLVNARKQQFANQTVTVPPRGAREKQIIQGTDALLEEARQLAENAVGQGQDLSPQMYAYLGLQPQYQDNTAQLDQAGAALTQAQTAFDTARQTIDTLRAIPKGKRTAAQNKQLRMANKSLPNLQRTLADAKDTHGRFASMPKTITGLSRMDPGSIPPDSPFSSQNPLNQAQAKTTETLNAALRGEYPIDPTIAHEFDRQEQALRARLTSQYGPDYENSSVGQMALQAFGRTKADAFATYNRGIVEQYSNLAYGGAANLQALAGNQLGLWLTPSQNALQGANALEATAVNRLPESQLLQSNRLATIIGHQDVTATSPYAPLAAGIGAAGTAASGYFTNKALNSLFGPSTPASDAAVPSGVYPTPTYTGQTVPFTDTGAGAGVGTGAGAEGAFGGAGAAVVP